MTVKTEEKTTAVTRFIDRLVELKAEKNTQVLAACRRALLNSSLWMEPYQFLNYLVPSYYQQGENNFFYAVAGLFAFHPLHSEENKYYNFGEAMRKVVEKHGTSSFEKRFVALLKADKEEVPQRLFALVSMAKNFSIPIDYKELLRSLLHWDDPKQWVQKKWGNSFWSFASPDAKE